MDLMLRCCADTPRASRAESYPVHQRRISRIMDIHKEDSTDGGAPNPSTNPSDVATRTSEPVKVVTVRSNSSGSRGTSTRST